MKLAIIRRRYARFGGAERFIDTAARQLVGEGVEVSIISQSWSDDSDNVFNRITVPERGMFRYSKLANFQREVAALVASGNFNLVQTHERLLTADLFRAGDGVHAAWVERKAAQRGMLRASLMRFDPMHKLVMETERRMARETSMTFVANSALVAREIRYWLDVPDDRIRIIENGVDTEMFHRPSKAERAAARKKFGLDPDVPVVVFVGSGFDRKGASVLIDALALPGTGDVHALIAGHDRRLKTTRRRVAELGLSPRVKVLGGLDDPLTAYHAADLFALPSLYDPMPNAALEALGCGLPILVTGDTGIADHVRASGAGVVVTRAPDDIAQGIRDILANHAAMTRAAAGLVPRFDLATATERWLSLYKELL